MSLLCFLNTFKETSCSGNLTHSLILFFIDLMFSDECDVLGFSLNDSNVNFDKPVVSANAAQLGSKFFQAVLAPEL